MNVWLPPERPLLGTLPANQACALTGNQTIDPLLCRPTLSPLSDTSQGYLYFLIPSTSSPIPSPSFQLAAMKTLSVTMILSLLFLFA